jgi:hypothetical protein
MNLRYKLRAQLILGGLFVSGCMAGESKISEEVDKVKRYVDFFNQKDLKSLLSYVTNDISWMYVNGDNLLVETQGKEQLKAALQVYFNDYQTQSSLIQLSGHGDFVQAVEKATWQSNGKEKSQCSAVTYQLEKGLIKAVWYFDSYSC